MTILPKNLLKIGMRFYQLPYSVTDYVYSTIEGEDRKTVDGTRTVKMAVNPSGGKRLEEIFGGSVSDGDIGIWTESALFILDEYELGSTRKQSIVSYNGMLYFVAELSDWTDQAGLKVYRASRYVDQAQGI